MLVAIDQITSARTPGKKPKPNRLSSPSPAITARNVIRKETAPMSATTPIQRAKTPLRSVSSPAASEERGKAHCGEEERPGRGSRHCSTHDGIRVGTLGRRGRDHDDGHGHARDARSGHPRTRPERVVQNRERVVSRSSEHASDRPREVQEHEACEQHRERTDAALPLVVVRPASSSPGPPRRSRARRHRWRTSRQERAPRTRRRTGPAAAATTVGECSGGCISRASSGGRSASPS